LNKSQLARELHRYVAAQRGEEPPEGSAPDPVDRNPDSKTQPEPSPDRQERLDDLESRSVGCEKCKLSEERKQVVFADGDAGADVFVIGEAPGAQEDEEGLPFVGKAGELLRRGFEKVGLPEENVYITNTVKCRPPGNRDPHREELDACRPYLDEQFDLVDPDVVLALGSFAIGYCLDEDTGVGASRGTVYEFKETQLVTTYHPAYILRNNNQAQKFINDLNRAKNLAGEN
jgi:uracil-DNA glycosylase family 4